MKFNPAGRLSNCIGNPKSNDNRPAELNFIDPGELETVKNREKPWKTVENREKP